MLRGGLAYDSGLFSCEDVQAKMQVVYFEAYHRITSRREKRARLGFRHRLFVFYVLPLGHACSLDYRRRGEVVTDADRRLDLRGRSHGIKRGVTYVSEHRLYRGPLTTIIQEARISAVPAPRHHYHVRSSKASCKAEERAFVFL